MLIKRNKENNIDSEFYEIKKELRANGDDIAVDVVNISNGYIAFNSKMLRESYEWHNSGDVLTLSYSTLLNMINESPKMLRTIALGIVDVINGNEIANVENITKALGLNHIYEIFDYNIGNIDGYILDTKLDEFEILISKCPRDIVERITERAIMLSREKYLDSKGKQEILENALDKEFLFSDD